MHLELDKRSNVVVEAGYVKRFANTKYLLARLSKAERLLLDHITIAMGPEDNIFVNDSFFRENFNQVFIDIGATAYTNSTISKCLGQLKKLMIIDSIPNKRGTYKVNPLFFVRGSEISDRNTHRDNLVRDYLEQATRQQILNRENS